GQLLELRRVERGEGDLRQVVDDHGWPPEGSEHELVDEAPAPGLAALQRAHDGVGRRAEVAGRVLARRVVAATDVPALEAHAQVHPLLAAREELAAALRRGRPRADVI